jgi:UDP-N-acetylglucosamine 2-epimerase (non-hydrolysing)
MTNLIITEPLGYLDFVKLTARAKLVLTDSGGIQGETTVLGVSCITLRESAERPITVEVGTIGLWNFAGTHHRGEPSHSVRSSEKKGSLPELWDGHAAKRIVRILLGKRTAL